MRVPTHGGRRSAVCMGRASTACREPPSGQAGPYNWISRKQNTTPQARVAATYGPGDGLEGAQFVTPFAIAALWRRHLAAVAVVFIVAAGLGYHFKHAVPGYTDTATVAFIAPEGTNLFDPGENLLVVDELTTNSVMSQTGHDQVTKAGGTATYDVALINLNTEDYPNYSDPYVTVTASSLDPVAAQHTFSAVMQVLRDDLAQLQARQGAKPNNQILARTIAAPTGPIAQTGSSKRTLAGLLVLAIIAAYMVARFLDRHPVRLRELRWKKRRLNEADRWSPVPFGPRAD